jgi:hypothetical protein
VGVGGLHETAQCGPTAELVSNGDMFGDTLQESGSALSIRVDLHGLTGLIRAPSTNA